MVAFGVAVGAAMVYVREQTGLANDTVIGVFFALAIGFGAMLFQVLQQVSTFNPENFLFGTLLFVPETDLRLPAAALVAGRRGAVRVAVQPARVRQLQPEPRPHPAGRA